MSGNPTVAAVIAKDLASYGAKRCFGLLGTANFKVSHALVEAGVELIKARHECNAASMADAYAKSTGELTLVSVHSGPGLTNALTGIAEAAKSRTPLVVLAGDVPNGQVKNNFYIEQAEMVRAVGAVSERLHSMCSTPHLLQICRHSNCRRRPGGSIRIRMRSPKLLMHWNARSGR
jgi:thiamine pyrophosphate-dependent acetolactate synthase large subunit-like protein